jgi:predicted flap endonuclease-1-like 5' DNA nuclease
MTNEPINTPSLAGWVIAAGIGAVAFAVGYVLLGLGANGSALVGGVLALVVGVILGLPSHTVPEATPAAHPVTHPAAQPVAASAAPVAEPAAAAAMPAPAPAAPAAPAAKPPTLSAARDGRPDDLKLIKGVGPKLEEMLHRMGIYHFDQIAAWQAAELAWVDDNLEGFKGRASRDEWVAQARTLAAGGAS